MELPQIKHFVNLADTLNFTQAAKLSNIAQPSLTKSIKKLEDELGGLLVYRDGKDTRLTSLGRDVLIEFTRIIQIEEGVHELAKSNVLGERKFLNFAVVSTVSPKPISRFINHVLANIPTLEITLHPLYRMNAVEELLAGNFDGCFLGEIPTENRKLSVLPLFKEDFHVASSSTHRFAKETSIPSQILAEEMYVDRLMCEYRSRIIEYFMKRDVLMHPRFASEREDWVQQIVAAGNGICILPKNSIISEGIITRPIENLDLQRDVVFASVSGSGNAKVLHQVRQMAEKYDWIPQQKISK